MATSSVSRTRTSSRQCWRSWVRTSAPTSSRARLNRPRHWVSSCRSSS
ncbi:UPF0468 protein [Phytophthora nicotianae]|uniref:UPF0468 protein n=1 Tax=Phytophthora nicotianae TaxID=4792 RepID=W2N7R2_PHYNI|nr:UPF0468 protein [Phytophthora nicotianae]